ncbi:hypothetical protein L6452_37472 [Arctium lappa]|uniref:Uncharacterized protein n=1 Tax=Arctium lappa TaxID=4217 RepID=A0ACB8Y3J8_ARCLA|nr:hypothetical protein L6452_37472 [Arctium lappa]
MLLTTKTTTIFLWVSPIHQFESKKYLVRHKNVKLRFKLPSRSSQLLSPTFDTNSCTRIPATLSLSSTSRHQVADYDADICRFCAVGNLQKAMDLVCSSEEIILDLKTYCDILQLCAELKALHHGKRVHNLICSRGIELNSVLGSKLVFIAVHAYAVKDLVDDRDAVGGGKAAVSVSCLICLEVVTDNGDHVWGESSNALINSILISQ